MNADVGDRLSTINGTLGGSLGTTKNAQLISREWDDCLTAVNMIVVRCRCNTIENNA